jgi:Uncharacterized conserved protein (DUF2249)
MPDAPSAAGEEHFLDLRGLEPPEPLMRVFAALEEAPDRPLRIRLNREPFPLYPMLLAGGWKRRTITLDEGGYDVVISRTA